MNINIILCKKGDWAKQQKSLSLIQSATRSKRAHSSTRCRSRPGGGASLAGHRISPAIAQALGVERVKQEALPPSDWGARRAVVV